MNPSNFTNILAPIAGFAALIGLFLASLRAVIALTPGRIADEHQK
jgi:hypothetical protein